MLNNCIIAGRLTRDPDLRYTTSGTAVTRFTLAVDRDVKNSNGERETDYIDVVAWRQTAEFVSKYFSKGRMAIVSGRLQIRDWTDKDGIKRKAAEINAENVYFGGDGKRGSNGNDQVPSTGTQATQGSLFPPPQQPAFSPQFDAGGSDDDLPF